MGDLLNFEELAVFFSLCGVACLLAMLRVRPSQPWQESAGLKRGLLAVGAAVLQLPVVWVVMAQPPYVTSVYTVEPFRLQRLLAGYLIQGAVFIGVAILVRRLD